MMEATGISIGLVLFVPLFILIITLPIAAVVLLIMIYQKLARLERIFQR
ncbi:MAG: hypothetical protein ACOX5R_18895 [bacterium]|jgi:hypothetical protein